VPDLNVLVEHWDEIIERVREAKRNVLAAMLVRAAPIAVAATGLVTIEVENDATALQAVEAGRDDVLAAIRASFPAIARVNAVRADRAAAVPERLTNEALRLERMAALRRKDPVLGAAIDELDLDLMD
jgi:hypothetical protein